MGGVHDSGTIEQQQRQGSGLTRERDKRGRGSGGGGDREDEGPSATENTRLGIALHRRKLQRKAEREAREGKAPAIPREGGAELAPDVRNRMERGLGAPIPDGVKVHTGGASGDAAKALGARAFTDGGDIHFAPGQFAPGTPQGDHLLAHELAHTIQGGGGVQRKAETDDAGAELEVSQPGDAAEVEADQAADAATGALHGAQRAERPRIGAQLGGVGRKVHLAPDGDKPGPQAPGGAQKAAAGGQAATTPDASKGPPEADRGSPGTGADKGPPGAETWPQAKAALMAGQPPAAGLLPPTPGNEAGIKRLAEVHADQNLPPDVRAAFLAHLASKITTMAEPITDLHRLMRETTFEKPDLYLRKGKKMPSADYIRGEMGGLRRALSLKWLCANGTDDLFRRAHQLDPSIPDKTPAPKDAWGVAGAIVPLIKSGKLKFDAMADVNSGAMIGDYPPGASGWFFAGKDIPEGIPPPEMRVQIAAGVEYGEGYQLAELPPEMAAPNDKGEGGASRPTALDLCLAPEGKLNPNQDEPAGRTDPAALKPGQADAREVVMPPIPLSSTKRGPLVLA